MSPEVIIGMATCVYLAVLKDVVLCWLMDKDCYSGQELDNRKTLGMKLSQDFFTFSFQDFVEVGLQFFYFEKFSFMPNDMLVYFNALFMIYKAFEVTVRTIMLMKEDWNERRESF